MITTPLLSTRAGSEPSLPGAQTQVWRHQGMMRNYLVKA